MADGLRRRLENASADHRDPAFAIGFPPVAPAECGLVPGLVEIVAEVFGDGCRAQGVPCSKLTKSGVSAISTSRARPAYAPIIVKIVMSVLPVQCRSDPAAWHQNRRPAG